MPEFHVNIGSFEDGKVWAALDAFTRGYLGAAFFTIDEDLEDYAFSDLAPEALDEIKADCAAFQADNRAVLDAEPCDNRQAGHDFWLTRNRHGAGFWDRGDDTYSEESRDALTAAAHACGECDLYVGDDGKLYLA